MKQKTEPPKFAARLLQFFSQRYEIPEIQGDLQELFYSRKATGSRFAGSRFWLETFHAMFTICLIAWRRKKINPSINPFHMVISNVTVGFRHMLKRFGYSLTTITGLSLGIVACLIIFYYVRFERSFDQYNDKLDNIAIVYYDFKTNDIHAKSPSTPDFVGPKFQREFSEVMEQVRVLTGFGSRVFKADDKMFEESDYGYADSSFFKVFTYKFLQGNPDDQLKRPATILLTKATAEKYFGKDNPIGKTVLVNNKREYEVTGVMENFPANSHIRFDMLMSMSSLQLSATEQWNDPNYITYLLLADGTDLKTLQDKVNETWLKESQNLKLELQPLRAFHFDTSVVNFLGKFRIMDERYLFIFSVTAILILLIACINYVNLFTARASERGREVGIRKISGATGTQLFFQFMTDSFLHILPAILISLLIFFGILPWVNDFLGLQLGSLDTAGNIFIFKTAGIILIVITFMAGLYPSFVMTKFKPVLILKGKFQGSRTAVSLRKGLVVFQFCISIALIVCAGIITSQLNYMQNKSLGFDKEHTLILPADGQLFQNFNTFKIEAEKLAAVTHVVPVSASPTDIVIGNSAGLNENDEEFVTVGSLRTTADFIEAMNIRIIAGRNFDRTSEDSTVLQFLVNETYLKKFGFTEKDVIGRRVWLGVAGQGEIIGIINDFHTASLHQKIEPVMVFNKDGWINKVLIKLRPGNIQEQLADIGNLWKKFAPHRPFAYSFLDENYNNLYKTEMRVNRLVQIFSGLAIIIACLGILGLASYSAMQRAKEIGIRKVLGASTSGIMTLMAKDFVILIGISFALSIPLAWFFSSDWLGHFEYHITINVFHFLTAGFIAFGFALTTIGYQTFKASRMNPAETLKTE